MQKWKNPAAKIAIKIYASNAGSLKCTKAVKLKFSGLGFRTIQCIHFKNKMLDKFE